jgi:8-oxo-dGTP pyrophosphatase MutT (NUDIX family)
MSFRPDVTVAAIVERDGQFLLVEERVANRMVFNQPAGHVERNETMVEAAIRETQEETAWTFVPEALVGIYLWDQPSTQKSFLRITFCGRVTEHDPNQRLDRGIERAVWMTREQIVTRTARLRSPMVLRCIDDYLAGRRYPLDVIRSMQGDLLSDVEGRRTALRDLPLVDRL